MRERGVFAKCGCFDGYDASDTILCNLHRPKEGGTKNDSTKSRVELITPEFIEATGHAFRFGATKYGEDNFLSGIAHRRLLGAAVRHILAILRGEDIDPESGLPHYGHAGASLAMYVAMTLAHPELNDIPKFRTKEK